MPFDPTDPNSFAANQATSPLSGMAQDRATGMLNQPQLRRFAQPATIAVQDSGTNFVSPISPTQNQIGMMMPGPIGMARGGLAQNEGDDLAGIKDRIRAEFAARGLDFDRFIQNPAVMDEVGKSLADKGQGGDTIVAHINPEEAALLKKRGGSGSINPHTGLPQFLAESDASYGGGGYGYGQSNYGSGGGGDTSGGWNTSVSNQSVGGGGSSSIAAARAADRASVPGYSADSTSKGGTSQPARPITPTPSTAGPAYSGGGGSTPIQAPNAVSPVGLTSSPLTMGQTQPAVVQTPSPQPTFLNVDPATGMPINTGSISGLGQLASMPDFTGTSLPAPSTIPSAAPVSSNISPVGLSDVDFTGMNAGNMGSMPIGLTNNLSSPIDPGYYDPGITAMRMSTYDPADRSISYYMDRLNELDPRFQTTALRMMNERMDAGIPTAVTPHGAGRSYADQVQLYAEKLAGLNPNPVAFPGTSLHSMDLPEGSLAIDLGGRSLTPEQTEMANQIATQAGAFYDPSDPGHFQAVPWQSGARQVAEAQYPAMQTTGVEPSVFRSAMDTVGNIASELFGVKPAQAETANLSPNEVARMTNSFYPDWFQTEVNVPPDVLGNLYNATEPFGGAETMSPFVGVSPELSFAPRSQQQMLNALGIAGQPVPPAPTQQEMLNTLGIKGAPYQGLLPGEAKIQDRAPTAPTLQNMVSPLNTFPMDVFGRPEDMATFGGARAQPAEGISGLTAFGLSGPNMPIENAPTPAQDMKTSLDERGTPYPQSIVDPNSYQNYRLDPDFAYQKMLASLGWKSMFAPGKEEAIAKMTESLQKAGSSYDPETGTLYAQDPATMQKALGIKPIELKDSEGNIVGTLNAADFLTPISTPTRTVPLPPTRTAEAAPVAGFGSVSPQTTGLSSFETALGGLPAAAPRITTGITSPLNIGQPAAEPRSELPVGNRMTPEELKSIGIYKDTLQPGETIRQDFNAAYADATKRGLDTFQWTNPKTGKTDFYASGRTDTEADLPAKTAKEASLLEPSDKEVAKLEDAGMIANGMSKEEYADAMGVSVDDVKTRITTQFGPPMVEYYVKSIGESLAGMTGGTSNFEGLSNLFSMTSPLGILGILGKNLYNQYAGKTPATATTPAPAADQTPTEYSYYQPSGGGGGGGKTATYPVSSGTKPRSSYATPPANVAADDTGLYDMPTTGVFADRRFANTPIDYENYGYGGEQQYYVQAARGGSVLNAMRKR